MQKTHFLSLLQHWIVYLFLIFFYGCQSIHHIPSSTDIVSFSHGNCSKEMDISGRISVQYTFFDENENKSLHGKFHWKSDNDKTRIDLMSPLGQTLAIVNIYPDEATFTGPIQTDNAKVMMLHAGNAEALLSYKLGWHLPVAGMQNWLQGCVSDKNGQPYPINPNEPKTTSDGWEIHYISWHLSSENKRVPRRIDMIYTPSSSAKTAITQIQIRLVIDSWQSN